MKDFLLFHGLKYLSQSIRWKMLHKEKFLNLLEQKQTVIFSCWHHDLLLMGFLSRYYFNQTNLSILTSLSKDGRLIGHILLRMGLQVSWGSSSRNAVGGFRSLIKEFQAGNSVCITPDGPRGPYHHVHPGIIALSQMTGKPILPLAYSFKKLTRTRSWDQMKIPYPWTKGVLSFGDLIQIPQEISDSDKKKYQELIRERLELLEEETISML